MLITGLIIGAIVLSVVLYIYGRAAESRHHGPDSSRQSSPGRDMWTASLLDCEYEPAKYVFGPGKAIPSKKVLKRAHGDKSFTEHMTDK